MSHRLSIYAIIVSVLMGLAFSSCGSSRSVTTARGSGKNKTSGHRPSVNGLDPTAKSLIAEADSWIGTPYKYGGNDRGGVDCSGFVTQVYLKALGIKLPRTSREQSEFCQRVDRSRLTPGDLIFFRTTKGSNRVSHVGIFVGENQMIHSSTSKGVIYTDLDSDYYTRTFAGAGKVGQYHAMLSSGSKQADREKKKKKNKKSKTPPVQESKPLPTKDLPGEPAEVHISTTESPAGYTLTPVTSLPSRTTAVTKETATEPEPVRAAEVNSSPTTPAPQPVTTVAAGNAAPIAEPSPEDARAAVLNSIIEKDLK